MSLVILLGGQACALSARLSLGSATRGPAPRIGIIVLNPVPTPLPKRWRGITAPSISSRSPNPSNSLTLTGIATEDDLAAVDAGHSPKPIVDHPQPGAGIQAQLQERRVVEPDGGRAASRQVEATTHTNAVTAILGAAATADSRLRGIVNADAIA